MSMQRSELECHLDLHTLVFLGARHSWDLGYRGELIAMQRYCPTFHYIPIISRPEEELVKWSGQTGYVPDLWDRGLVETAMGAKPTPKNIGRSRETGAGPGVIACGSKTIPQLLSAGQIFTLGPGVIRRGGLAGNLRGALNIP